MGQLKSTHQPFPFHFGAGGQADDGPWLIAGACTVAASFPFPSGCSGPNGCLDGGNTSMVKASQIQQMEAHG